ncbi:MAG: hypothetical protein LBJ87_03875, partial [bacterium]|nr:hypothetical protein [bacterium]
DWILEEVASRAQVVVALLSLIVRVSASVPSAAWGQRSVAEVLQARSPGAMSSSAYTQPRRTCQRNGTLQRGRFEFAAAHPGGTGTDREPTTYL